MLKLVLISFLLLANTLVFADSRCVLNPEACDDKKLCFWATEVIKDEFNGLILKNKNISIKDFLNLKKIDEEKMKILSKNAFQYANKNFSLESIVKKEIKLYESLI